MCALSLALPPACLAFDISKSCTVDQILTLHQIKLSCIYIFDVLLLSMDVHSKLVMTRHLVGTKMISCCKHCN